MMPQHHLPADIERTSMKIIAGELAQRGLDIPPEKVYYNEGMEYHEPKPDQMPQRQVGTATEPVAASDGEPAPAL